MIIYVFDITEPFPLTVQKKLLQNLKKEDKEVILYLSKTDILDEKKVAEFKKHYDVLSFEEIGTVLKAKAEKFYAKK